MTMSDVMAAQDEPGGRSGRPGPRAGRPKRRVFTAAYKQSILEHFDRLTDPAERGALLRREGLYHSHIEYWRATAKRRVAEATTPKPAGRPARDTASVENERLKKENERLRAELARTKAALDVVGKAHKLLEMLSGSADSDATQTK